MSGKPAAGGGLSLTYLQHATDDAEQSSYTFSAQNLGGAEPGRRIVVAVGARAGLTDITDCTIGGVSATRHAISAANVQAQYLALFSAVVPTGTTGDVVVTVSGQASRCGIALYAVTGGSSTLTDTDNRGTVGGLSLDAAAGGVCVAATYGYDVTAYTWSWSGDVTEDDEFFTDLETLRLSMASAGSESAQTLTATPFVPEGNTLRVYLSAAVTFAP